MLLFWFSFAAQIQIEERPLARFIKRLEGALYKWSRNFGLGGEIENLHPNAQYQGLTRVRTRRRRAGAAEYPVMGGRVRSQPVSPWITDSQDLTLRPLTEAFEGGPFVVPPDLAYGS